MLLLMRYLTLCLLLACCVIFCSSEAIEGHPELVQKYLGSVVPHSDNFYSALNGAVFSDETFIYIHQTLSLSSYHNFRINRSSGQFEHTVIVCMKTIMYLT